MLSVLPPHAHIPPHWELTPLGRIGRFLAGTGFPHEFQGAAGGDFPFFKVADFNLPGNERELRVCPNSISSSVARELGARLCPSGAIVFPKVGAALLGNKRRTTTCPSIFDNNLMALIPDREYEPGFVYWALTDLDFGRLSKPGPVPSLNEGDLRGVAIPVPDSDRQALIASFLDRKTAAIDALIAKKERLIELLQEKRQALITQAVTKGLDPNLPMKDSGVEWLGEIPAHWRCFRLKYLTPQLTVGIVVTPSKYYVEKGPGAIPCPRSFNVKADFIDHNDMAFISEESNRLHAKSIIRAGDLVAVRTGQPGTTAVVDDSLDGANCVDLIIIRQSSRFDSRFLCHYLNSAPAHYQYGSGAEGALQQHFNVETAKELLVPLPPRDEQTVLVAELDRRLEHLGRTLTAAARQEDVLHEYRQALISVAVTGKIEIPVEEAE